MKVFVIIKFERDLVLEMNETAFDTFDKAAKHCRINWDEETPRMIQRIEVQTENVVKCETCHKVIFNYNDPKYSDNHHESFVKKKKCSYCSMEKPK